MCSCAKRKAKIEARAYHLLISKILKSGIFAFLFAFECVEKFHGVHGMGSGMRIQQILLDHLKEKIEE